MALYPSLRRGHPSCLAAPFLALALVACAGAPDAPPDSTAQAPKAAATADESGFATDSGRRAVTARREMVAAVPHATIRQIPAAGHLVTLDRPGAVRTEVVDWLGSEVSAGRNP